MRTKRVKNIIDQFTFSPATVEGKGQKAACRHCGETILFSGRKGANHLEACRELRKKTIAPRPKKVADPFHHLHLRAARWIYCERRSLDIEIGSQDWIDLCNTLGTGLPLPTRDQLTGPLLLSVYKDCREKVEMRLAEAHQLNVILDVSESIDGRLLNVCVQPHSDFAFYWATISVEPAGPDYLEVLRSILLQITNSDLSRISSFTINVCQTTEAMRQLVLQCPDLDHCFWMPGYYHGFQLLIQDLLAACSPVVERANGLVYDFWRTYGNRLPLIARYYA